MEPDVYGAWTMVVPAFLLAISHALSPDHWFPFVVIGRANRWRTSSVLGLAFLAAAGHVVSSIAVALLSVFAKQGAPRDIASFLQEVTPTLLIVFGTVYALVSAYKLRVSRHGHSHGLSFVNRWFGVDPHDYDLPGHDHDHRHDDDCGHEHGHCEKDVLPKRHLSSRAAWGLVLILGVTPCVALLPITFAAVRYGTFTVILACAVFAVSAITSILVATWLALHGMKLLRLKFFDKYGGITAGVIITLIGVAGHLLEHSHHLDH
jgi:nickel/cobalt exporter